MYIRQFQKKLLFCLSVRTFVFFASVYLFFWGTVTLMLRTVWAVPLHQISLGGLGLLPLFAAAFFMEKRRLPERTAVSALLDQYNQTGGLLMLAEETDISQWLPSDREIRMPAVQWKGAREWGIFAMALLFLFSAAFAPRYIRPHSGENPLQMEETAKKIAAEIDVLEEENILEKEKAREMKDVLEKLYAESQGKDPARTWEALDHLEENLRNQAEKAAQDMRESLRSFQQMQAVAEAISQDSGVKADVISEVMKEMGQSLSEMMQTGNGGPNESDESVRDFLSQDMAGALGRGNISEEELQQLSEQLAGNLQKMTEQMRQKLETLDRAGLAQFSPSDISPGTGGPDTGELEAFLNENAENMGTEDILAFMPGKGGTDRGRADAAMTWKERSSEAGAEFKEETLPLSELSTLRDNLLMGISQGTPEENAGKIPVSPGVLSELPAGSGSAIIRKSLPRHKEAIRRYFDRQGAEEDRFIFDEVWSGWG